MSIFHSLGPSLPQIPDNLTLPQFLLDKHPLDFLDRTRKDIDAFNLQLRDDLGLDCGSLIEEDTGRQLRFSEVNKPVSQRTEQNNPYLTWNMLSAR
jgi:hypothetical protein